MTTVTRNILVGDIINTLKDCVEWWVDNNKVTVLTMESRDPSRRNNGGEYDYYRVFELTPEGTIAYDDWSCDFQNMDSPVFHYPDKGDIDDLVRLFSKFASHKRAF